MKNKLFDVLHHFTRGILMFVRWVGRIKHFLSYQKLRRGSPEERTEIMRDEFYYCGKNVMLYTWYFGTEPYLISIHDNVTCASEVKFVNHDVSIWNVARYLGEPYEKVEKLGSIELFENSFVGAWSILMPNTSVGRNSIVAAGSVVTKHIPDGEVWGGCPAHFIMKTEDYAKKTYDKSQQYPWTGKRTTMTKKELVKMQQQYFFENKEKNI